MRVEPATSRLRLRCSTTRPTTPTTEAFIVSMGHFSCWISLSLKPKTETKRLNFGLSPEFKLTNHRGAHHCSLHNVITDVIANISVFLCLFVNLRKSEVIFVHQSLISNRLTYLVHTKSTGELISFKFSDRSVRSLVSAIVLSESLSLNEKKRLHFLADLWSQSEFRTQRKSQRKTDPKKVKWHIVAPWWRKKHDWKSVC